jgi:hypothetical protein
LTISLKRNNVPLAPPESLLSRLQSAAGFTSKRKLAEMSEPMRFRGTKVPALEEENIADPAAIDLLPLSEAAEAMPTDTAQEASALPQITMPSRPLWRAWREKGETAGTTVLRVVGLCPFVPGINGRIVLQESVITDHGHHWGGEGAKSGLLILERLMVPPTLGEIERPMTNPQQIKIPPYAWCYPWEMEADCNKKQPLLVTFRKEEKDSRSALSQMPIPMTASSHYTHVTILPDGITVPIQE